jgi:hypothetical protein
MDADLVRIAFVSRRFNELKGLLFVCLTSPAAAIGLLLEPPLVSSSAAAEVGEAGR